MNDIVWMSAQEMRTRIANKELSARDVAGAMVERIDAVNPKINAVINYDPDKILQDAQALDEKQARGEKLGPLHGIPYTIKDITAVKGLPLTLGIKALKDNVVDYDAPIVERMKDADGLFLGKTNTPEAAYCGRSSNHLFGVTRNPWNLEMSAGGSSSGAAAGVAAGIGALAEGSDGGGSIRVPASLNGVVGFKPSLGRVPHNLLSSRYATHLFQGPITRTVADAALMLDATVGEDYRDPKSPPHPGFSYVETLERDIRGLRVAYSPDLGLGNVDEEIADIVRQAVYSLQEAGASVEEVTPKWENPNDAMWQGAWVPGLASLSSMFELDEMEGELDAELIQLVRQGDSMTVTDFSNADAARGAFFDVYAEFMRDFEILASPTSCVASFPAERFAPEHLDGETLKEQLLGWNLTHPFNLTTAPAISIPCGFTSDGRPVGLQLAGRLRRDEDVLQVAHAFEQMHSWFEKHPSL